MTPTGSRRAAQLSGLQDADSPPELDVSAMPHVLRHPASVGAIESLAPGAALALLCDEDPLRLLTTLRAKHGRTYRARYVQSGPDRWRVIVWNAV